MLGTAAVEEAFVVLLVLSAREAAGDNGAGVTVDGVAVPVRLAPEVVPPEAPGAGSGV